MNTIQKFTNAKQLLLRRRDELAKELEQIEAALNGHASPPPQRRASQVRSGPSLASLVKQVTAKKPMTKQDILAAVQKAGYVFTGAKPMASLNTLLYGKDNGFQNKDGKFSAK